MVIDDVSDAGTSAGESRIDWYLWCLFTSFIVLQFSGRLSASGKWFGLRVGELPADSVEDPEGGGDYVIMSIFGYKFMHA